MHECACVCECVCMSVHVGVHVCACVRECVSGKMYTLVLILSYNESGYPKVTDRRILNQGSDFGKPSSRIVETR